MNHQDDLKDAKRNCLRCWSAGNEFPNLYTWPGHDLFSALPTILAAKLNGETDLFNLAFLSDIVMAALAKVLVNWVLADGQQGTHVPSLIRSINASSLKVKTSLVKYKVCLRAFKILTSLKPHSATPKIRTVDVRANYLAASQPIWSHSRVKRNLMKQVCVGTLLE